MAAGSESRGFWFVFPSLPTKESGERQSLGVVHYYGEDELFYTPLHEVKNNTAHSARFGIFFDGVLLPDHGVEERGGKYRPRIDPKDTRSPPVATRLEDLTCYKVRRTCVWTSSSSSSSSS